MTWVVTAEGQGLRVGSGVRFPPFALTSGGPTAGRGPELPVPVPWGEQLVPLHWVGEQSAVTGSGCGRYKGSLSLDIDSFKDCNCC